MRTAATLALVLASFSIASADDAPPAPPPVEETAPVEATPTPPGLTAPMPAPAPVVLNVEAKATKRPGSVLHIPAPTQGQYAIKPHTSRTPALIATAATGVLLTASILSYRKFNSVNNSGHGDVIGNDIDTMVQAKRMESADRWMKISLGMFASTVISSAVTGYLWSRSENPGPSVNLEPTNSGVMFQYFRPIR
jgi:hypothetical protein